MHKDNLINIYKMPDEITGIGIKSLLEKEGIDCVLQSSQIPWYDSVMVSALGYWGEILVKEKDKEKAEAIIEDFIKSNKDKDKKY